MTRIRLVALLAIAVGAVAAPAPAATSLLIDAGPTQRVGVDTPFFLEAHVEGGSGAGSVSWTIPTGCSLEGPNAIVITASCPPGLHSFRATVLDGSEADSDDVAVVASKSYSELTVQTGTTGLTLLDGSGPDGSGVVEVPFTVPPAAVSAEISLDWSSDAPADFDLGLRRPDGDEERVTNSLTARPERTLVEPVDPGTWTAIVRPRAVVMASWTLRAEVDVVEGDHAVPALSVPGAAAEIGDPVTLEARAEGGTEPYEIAWEATPGSWRFDDGSGSTFALTFSGPTAVRAKVTDALGLETISTAFVRDAASFDARPLTVVAVVDGGFTPYHHDFLGSQHPWNVDADPHNDFDFGIDPAVYVDGYPGAEPIELTLPTSGGEVVTGREAGVDAVAWSGFRTSSLAGGVNMYRFPGTKIIGALSFGGPFFGDNSSHGTRSAASAAGNIHGTCPECLFVLINGTTGEALTWAASQPWIDVVTNSYGHCLSTCVVRDNIYLDAPTAATRAGVEAGNVIVFSSGNGLANGFDVPMLTYTTGEKGPDWIVTVGANSPSNDQNYLGAGKPVDISSVGQSYPSTGGGTANGTGTHSGTSNAAPVTAGMFAKVLQEARELLGDGSPGHLEGVVASGEPIACGAAVPGCALGDGILTRAELQTLVYTNVLPSPQQIAAQNVIPTTQYAYYYQGHGALIGRLRGDDQWNAEWTGMIANAIGAQAASARPPGEREWFVVDSKCRQRFWGSWTGGYFTGTAPSLDPIEHPLASAFDGWCSQVPQDMFGPR